MEEKGIWLLFLFASCLIPLTSLLAGMFFLKRTTSKRGSFGYRSRLSMQNDATWRFAQSTCGIVLEMVAVATFFPTIMLEIIGYFMGLKLQAVLTLIIITIQMVLVVFAIAYVDRSIKRNFDKDGQLKEEKTVAKDKKM